MPPSIGLPIFCGIYQSPDVFLDCLGKLFGKAKEFLEIKFVYFKLIRQRNPPSQINE
jgi:hypothetical protein